MGRRFWLDTVFATIFIFSFMWLASTLLKNVEALDPMGEALSDFEITDLAFSQVREDPLGDTTIVLVNIANLSRAGIAEQLRVINKYEPAVVGIDAFFYSPKDWMGDSSLAVNIANTENIVMVSNLGKWDEEAQEFDTVVTSHPMFSWNADHLAMADLITAAGEQQAFKNCRTFTPKEMADGELQYAFGVQLAMQYDSAKAMQFIDRQKDVEIINYRGNIMALHSSNYPPVFTALDAEDVLFENFEPSVIKDKIVIMGFMGESFFDQSWEDKFYTPMNKQYAGRTNPDMYGPIIHANIASMVLNEDYIDEMPRFLSLGLGILLCYVNVVLFSLIYNRIGRWYDGLTKLIQLLEATILWGVIIVVFAKSSYKMDLTVGIAAVLLAGDLLEVYNGVLKNLFSAEGRKQLFRVKKKRSTLSN